MQLNHSKMKRRMDTRSYFEHYFKLNVDLLRWGGMFSMNCVFTDEVKRPGTLETLFCGVITVLLLLLISRVASTMVAEWHYDRNRAIDLFCGMMDGTFCVIKGARLMYARLQVREFLLRLSDLWRESQIPDAIAEKVFAMATRTVLLRTFCVAMTGGLCVFYVAHPYCDLLRQYAFTKTENNSYNFTATVVHAKYPFPINDVWTYAGVLLYEQVICSYLVLYWMCCDSLFAQFATHTAIHIEVLRHDLVSIAENSDETEDSMLKRLANIAERHKRIFEYCEGIERIFSPVIFLSMLLTAICLCTCMHQLETMSSEGNYLEIGKYLVHLASLFVQTIIYCGYSNLLTDETEQMAHAAYNCDWTNRNQKFKRMLQMILMRSQKPFSCTAYGFFPVSLNQVTTIFSTAISYFTVLKTMA